MSEFTDENVEKAQSQQDWASLIVEERNQLQARVYDLEKALRRLEAVGSELDDTSPAEVWAELSAALNSARAALKGRGR